MKGASSWVQKPACSANEALICASLAKAQELGATVAIPLVDNGQITFAHLVDPDGNRFAIWRPNGAGM